MRNGWYSIFRSLKDWAKKSGSRPSFVTDITMHVIKERLLWIHFLSIIIFHLSKCTGLNSMSFIKCDNNLEIQTHIITQTAHFENLLNCARFCVLNMECRAISYNSASQLCQLSYMDISCSDTVAGSSQVYVAARVLQSVGRCFVWI